MDSKFDELRIIHCLNKSTIWLRFSGGAEFLFNKIKKHEVSLYAKEVSK